MSRRRPGVQEFNIYLNYEKTTCDNQEPPICVPSFVSTTSQTYSIIVRAGAGDADCDGKVTSLDAALSLQDDAGLIAALPCNSAATRTATANGRLSMRHSFCSS